jgi:hypothetical protein
MIVDSHYGGVDYVLTTDPTESALGVPGSPTARPRDRCDAHGHDAVRSLIEWAAPKALGTDIRIRLESRADEAEEPPRRPGEG